jgi:trehalose/maltose hydrolase-like predicted phosphorylase
MMGRTGILAVAGVAAVLASTATVHAAPSTAAVQPTTGQRAASPAASAGIGTGAYVLTATSRGPDYAPTFTGNGYLGVRIPAKGQGLVGGTVPAQSELAGFYAKPPGSDEVQERADLPTWSTLAFTEARQTFSLASGSVTGWRQQLDLHSGVISTTARWTAPNGRVTDLRYDVFTDRARRHVGVVRLRVTPHWSGTAKVRDLIDGSPATSTTAASSGSNVSAGQVWETVRTMGTGIEAGLASQVAVSPSAAVLEDRVLAPSDPQSVGQSLRLTVRSGQSFTVTKYVGIASSQDAGDPAAAARGQATSAMSAGYASLATENRAAWARLWAGRIDIHGNPALATRVNASQFYLWSSTRAGSDWSISPAGLSSDGYSGHIFWDAETWMYPSLLAQHPTLAAGMNAYRYDRLQAAVAHARAGGYRGARYPWESALDGTEQIPPPVSINSEGLFEQHVTSDIALAQWQYYLTTADRSWLRTRGWPVLSKAAMFWASRVQRGPDGYHIRHVTGPDEENPDVDDEAYTNVAAATTLRNASTAGRLLGLSVPSRWDRIAERLVVGYDAKLGVHREFTGYRGQLVKQADVTMLQYPWRYPMPARVAQNDLDYYVPRTDPTGPSMSDAISSIDTSALGSPGCAAYVYTLRSADPFIRDVFDQFSETSIGGAFTFMTGIGGFLQEFLYGYPGMRWDSHAVRLDPSLTSQLSGVTLHAVRWRGRTFDVHVGPTTTRLAVTSGPALPVRANGGLHRVREGAALTIPTSRPDLTPTSDVARCQQATASSAEPLGPPLAAVDHSPATFWQPTATPAALTVPLGRTRPVDRAVLLWGRQWPPVPGPNVPAPPGPVLTLRATAYVLLTSRDGHSWTRVAGVHGRSSGRRDVLSFPRTPAGFIKVRILSSTHQTPPKLQELVVTGGGRP